MNALKEGLTVGRYVLLAPVPSSDGSDVWLVRTPETGASDTPLVLRSVVESLANDDELMNDARDEWHVAAGVEHPHLASLVELFHDMGRWFFVSEFVSGRSLRQIMNRAGTLDRVPPVWFTVHVAAVVCQALAHLHARCGELGTHLQSLRHVVSPDSIVVSFAGDPKLLVFGLSSTHAMPTARTRAPNPDAVAYAAPERLGEMDLAVTDVARSDVYSLGVVLYEMLTARWPYAADGDENRPRAVRDRWREPPPPRGVAPWITQLLEDIVLRAMARDPRERFRHAGELGEAIQKYMAWAGLQPSRKHVAQQVCGMVAHADSEPPPSARSQRSSEPPPVVPRAPRAPSYPPGPPAASAPTPQEHVWDRVTAMARQQREAERRRSVPPAARFGGGVWERAKDQVPSDRPTSCQRAVACFEEGLDLARNRDYAAALVKLEEAVRLEPDNRVYGANLRRLKKQLENEAVPGRER